MAEANGATANRHLALIRAILRKACYEWEWTDWVPKVKLYKEPKRRVRWITAEQATALLAELPEHQREMVLFALATRLRQRNISGPCWSQVVLPAGDGRLEIRGDGAALAHLAPARMAKHAAVIVSLLHDPTSQHDRTTQQKRGHGTP